MAEGSDCVHESLVVQHHHLRNRRWLRRCAPACAVLAHCGLHRRLFLGAVLLCRRGFGSRPVIQRRRAGVPGRLLAS